jgi:hypothetical protein
MIGACLTAQGTGTRVVVTTDLDITGKAAQFGRGVMVDVGNKIIGQFAGRLAEQLQQAPVAPAEVGNTAGESASADGSTTAGGFGTVGESASAGTPKAASPTNPASDHPPVKPVVRGFTAPAASDDDVPDFLRLAGPAVAKRLIMPAAAALGALIVILIIRALRRR